MYCTKKKHKYMGGIIDDIGDFLCEHTDLFCDENDQPGSGESGGSKGDGNCGFK